MECMCAQTRLWFILSPKRVFREYTNSKEKNRSTGGIVESRTCDAASRRTASTTHYRLSYSGPIYAFSLSVCVSLTDLTYTHNPPPQCWHEHWPGTPAGLTTGHRHPLLPLPPALPHPHPSLTSDPGSVEGRWFDTACGQIPASFAGGRGGQ